MTSVFTGQGVLATVNGDGVGHALLAILVVLVAAKIAAELAERVAVPGVLAEIVAGIAIGPSALGLVESGETLRVLGEIGVILLLLEVGLEMDLRELRAVGRSSLLVALLGVVVPFATGYALVSALGHDGDTALFVGAALTATSVGITARVFGDLRALATREARTVLGAAVADDVLGLVILTVVVRMVTEGSISALSIVGVVATALAFLVVTGAAGLRLAPPLFAFVHRHSRSAGTFVAVALAFTLAFSELATVAKLAPIIGAFLAGIALGRSDHADRVRRELAPAGHLFIPVFFLSIGIDTDVRQMVSPDVLGVAAALLVVAVAGKLVAGFGLGRRPGDKLLVGLGMLPRGEVGLIFAGIGLREGVFGDDLYAALLLVVLLTTLMAPPLLRARMGQVRRSADATPPPPTAPPPGGWIGVERGEIVLRATPPPTEALPVAMRAAVAAADARPSTELLDWIAALERGPLAWDDEATARFLEVLEAGDTRSWRFLEATGVLDRAFPELAAAISERRADPFRLDPAGLLAWEVPDRLHELVVSDSAAATEHARLAHPERLLVAALLVDAQFRDVEHVVRRLAMGVDAERDIAALVTGSGLLRTATRRPDGLSEHHVLHLAAHLERPERARALYLLSLALGDLEPWERKALDELHGLVQDVLARDAAAVVGHAGPARAFVLSQSPDALARQSAMLQSRPGRREVRVAVTPEAGEGWRIDVITRDRPGLLAAVAWVLAEAGLDVVEAAATTWPDGGAVETFLVRGQAVPPAEVLAARIAAARRGPAAVDPLPEAIVTFDDDASPWHTLCEVRAADRRGLLCAIASAVATSGADVHSARIVTHDGEVVDRFELTDRRGAKLDDATKRLLAARIGDRELVDTQ